MSDLGILSPYYRNTLLRRLERLTRYKRHRGDGHGNELSDEGLRLVEHCIVSTWRDLSRIGCRSEARRVIVDGLK